MAIEYIQYIPRAPKRNVLVGALHNGIGGNMRKGGCWIFLSHASQDIKKVRIVRNEFERLGHNPLAFHLKCLSTDTAEGRYELDSLIKREIDAREWFVFCNSPDAARSEHVQEEQVYIINTGKDKIWTIDMTTDIDSILHKVQKICTDIEVYISYEYRDRDKVRPLINALVKKDFSVWIPEDIKLGENIYNEMSDAIIRCTYRGFYIIVITQESIHSEYVKMELVFAISHGARIVPIVIGNPELPDDVRNLIGIYQQISAEPTEEDYTRIVDMLDSMVKKESIRTSI